MKNLKLKKLFTYNSLFVIMLFFYSCTHKSELKHENGIVIEKQFSPEFNGSGVGFGMSTSGKMVVTNNDVHKSEQFMIVFKCQHNTIFTIDRKDLYANLEKGDSVDIQYYELLNSDNIIEDFDFYTATKK